ncbi:HEPN domain-containing protein [bacterium]|nr:HEPN domain-containing protein [bacterium]
MEAAEKLTEYAVDFRYPGEFEDITSEDWLYAVELAEKVLKWVETTIKEYKIKG